MTAQHQIDARSAADQFTVTIGKVGRTVHAKVRQADDNVTTLALLQITRRALCYAIGRDKLHPLIILRLHQPVGTSPETDDTDAQASFLYNEIWFHQTAQLGAGEVIVGAYEREVGLLHQFLQIVQTEIKLMVAQSCRVIAHLVHQLHLYLALEHRIERRALGEVTAVKQQNILLLRTHLGKISIAARRPSHVRIGRVGGIEWLYAAVRVVSVEDSQLDNLRHRRHCG